jgi:hypothetical protein
MGLMPCDFVLLNIRREHKPPVQYGNRFAAIVRLRLSALQDRV